MGGAPDESAMAARKRAAIAALRVDASATEAVRALCDAGLHPILLKGKSFATLLYPEGGRSYGDTDLLVAPDDARRASEVLAALGYKSTQAGYAAIERDTESTTLVRRRGDADADIVDLHWNLHLAGDPSRTWSALDAEREPMRLGALSVDVLSVPARAMHVAMHAAQHGLHGPQRYELGGQTGEDLRRAVERVSEADWRRAIELANAIGAEGVLAYGLRLVEEGARLADHFVLPRVDLDVSRFRTPFRPARGGSTLQRLLSAQSPRERVALLYRTFVPSAARVRKVANTRLGRASLAGAYAEYWWDAARGIAPAARDARALRRASRRVGDEAREVAD